MNYHEKLHKAIVAHFMCHKSSLQCDTHFEDSVDAARAFYEHLKGSDAYGKIFHKLMKQDRYKNKLILVKRYLNEN